LQRILNIHNVMGSNIMSAKDKPVSKPMNQQFEDNYDRIFGHKQVPVGEDTRPKDRVKQGISPSTIIEDWPIGGKK